MIENAAVTQPTVQADHRILLPGNEWALWRRVGLRSAGFPAALVRRLSVPECAVAAMELCAAERALAAVRDEACRRLEDLMRAMRHGEDEEPERLLLRKTLRRLRKGKSPTDLSTFVPEFAAALTDAADRVARASQIYRRSYAAALSRQSREIRELARWESLRTAILWQNRKVFAGGLDRLAQDEPEESRRNQQRRRSERLLASYLQRYTVKNDTIGAFGPSGWATFVDGPAIGVRPGPEVIASRSVYLETWALEEVARRLAKEPAARPDLRPVRRPFVRLRGDLLVLPMQQPVRLQPVRSALLNACDGTRTAREIAVHLLGDPRLGLRHDAEVYRLFEGLFAMGLIDWSFQVPVHPDAAQILQWQIERLQDATVRGAGLAALAELEDGRLALAAARHPEALDRGLAGLESAFSRLTGAQPERNPGMTYGGRTLAYEECRRDVVVELGPEIHRALAEPLELVLQSARWFTFAAAREVQRALWPVYRSLAPGGSAPVEMLEFWSRLQSVEPALTQLFAGVKSSLHQRWQQIFEIAPGQRRIHFRCADLRERVQAVFSAPAPGWPLARYHNPDVMIAANGVEALRHGEFQLVLGELHVAACSLNVWALLSECAERREVFADLEADFPEPRVVFLEPRDLPGLTARTRRAHFSPRDILIAPPEGGVPLPGQAGVPLSELILSETAGELLVTSRDGRLAIPLIEFLGDILTVRLTNQFSLMGPRRHTPRITMDRLVVARESWSVGPEELAFAWNEEGAGRFLAAQQWAHSQGLPRAVFVRTPVEQKPFYVDFDSPIYVDILAHAVRRTRENVAGEPIRLIEMLPGIQEVWLPDAQKQLYASELRILAVDLSAFARSGRTLLSRTGSVLQGETR